MASCNLGSDCAPLFMVINYFWWQEITELYVKHEDIDLWQIMNKGPIIIENSKDQLIDSDYNVMPKKSKAINVLYCGLSINICEYVFYYKSAKEIWHYLYYSCGIFIFSPQNHDLF